jgi:hypothetical protein
MSQKMQKMQKMQMAKDSCYSYILSFESLGGDANGELAMPQKSNACTSIPKCQKFVNNFVTTGKEFNILNRWINAPGFTETLKSKSYTQQTKTFLKTECTKEFSSKKDADQCMLHMQQLASPLPQKVKDYVSSHEAKFESLQSQSKECFVSLGKPLPK